MEAMCINAPQPLMGKSDYIEPASDEDRLINSLATEAQQLCERLFAVVASLDRIADVGSPARVTEQRVRSILKARRTRAQFLDPELFADPAWDMLLELLAAELGQYRLPVSSLCIGAAAPATTALRWLGTLETKGLVRREHDQSDKRRSFILLTPAGSKAMKSLLEAMPTAEPFL